MTFASPPAAAAKRGETWSGFSGSCPFGSMAYAGALRESTRSGADAHPASSNAVTTLTKRLSFLSLIQFRSVIRSKCPKPALTLCYGSMRTNAPCMRLRPAIFSTRIWSSIQEWNLESAYSISDSADTTIWSAIYDAVWVELAKYLSSLPARLASSRARRTISRQRECAGSKGANRMAKSV